MREQRLQSLLFWVMLNEKTSRIINQGMKNENTVNR